MEGYYRTNGGCFDGDGQVLLANNTFIQVKDLKKGDRLFNMNNSRCIIECIIKQNINSEVDVCSVNEMLISPYHPIFIFNKWMFPATEFKIQKRFITSFYNIILNNNDTIVINFIPVITLGHTFNSNIITKHEYFGTSKIRDDLKLVQGYNEGLIECKIMQNIRCCITNIVKKVNIIFETNDNTSNIITDIIIDNTSNITDNTSNIIDNNTSNIIITDNTSNIIDNTSNIIDNTSNIIIDNNTSNIIITDNTSNIIIDN